MSADHIEVLREGGLVEEQVLTVPVNEDTTDTFLIDDCRECDTDISQQAEVYVWGEPHGRSVTLKVYCSQQCVQAVMQRRSEQIGKDIMVVYLALRH